MESSVSADTTARGVSGQGITAVANGASGYIAFAASDLFLANQWTTMSVVSFPSLIGTTAISTVAASVGSGTADRSVYLDGSSKLVAYIYDGNTQFATDTVAVVANVPYVLGASSNGATLNAWKNGVLAATQLVSNGGYGYGGVPPVQVVGYGAGGGVGGNNSNAQVALHACWDRQLSAAEQASFAANPWQIFDAERATLFVPQGAGTTSVQLDSDVRWSMLGAASKDCDARWSMLSSAVKDGDLRWSLLGAAQANADVRWAMLSSVQHDSDLRWSMLVAAQKDSDLRWSMLGAASKDADLRWSMLSAVLTATADADIRWSMLASVQAGPDIRWTALASATKDADCRWQLLGTAQRDADLRWSALGAAAKNSDVRWSMLSAVVHDIEIRWRVGDGAPVVIGYRSPHAASAQSQTQQRPAQRSAGRRNLH